LEFEWSTEGERAELERGRREEERPQAKHPEHEIEEASQRGWFFLWSLTEFGDEGERSSPRRPGE
jgi:hypothetical protein